ncbi:MAG: helix-turn-helix transcriptional regulator [Clostridia bacterium]|nr:helix-turn-helix transcriptional regulator [Clostridia bacterium]
MAHEQENLFQSAYESMAPDRHDYDAYYSLDETWGLYALHCHDFYELYIHFSGAKFYCVDNNVYPLESCQLMVLPPFCMHGLIGDSAPVHYERAFLYITPSMLRNCGGGFIDLERFLNKYHTAGQYHFLLKPEDAQVCKQLIQEIHANLRTQSSVSRFANYTKVLHFLQIACQTMKATQEVMEPVVVNEAMHEILSYINDHFTQPLKLDALARQFGVSMSFLSHEFVKYTGRSVYDYVLYRRVLLAKAMITTNHSLNEVAYQCGFNDYSSFLRIFRKMVGMSPSAYRKANQLNSQGQ